MKLSIIIPVYNEISTIDKVIGRIASVRLQEGMDKEIVIVNDGSTDGTTETIEKHRPVPGIKIVNRNSNRGKTSAIIAGIKIATGDIFIIQDADLEYDPCHYPALIEPIIRKESPVVYGSRFKEKTARMPLINRMANAVSNITFNLLYGARISDIHTCYKVFSRDVVSGLDLTLKHFMFDMEITAILSKRGYKIYEVPITYTARTKKEGKKITWRQAMELYWCIIKSRFSP